MQTCFEMRAVLLHELTKKNLRLVPENDIINFSINGGAPVSTGSTDVLWACPG